MKQTIIHPSGYVIRLGRKKKHEAWVRKYWRLLVCVAMTAVLAVGCGGSGKSALDEIMEKRPAGLGYERTVPPFESKDGSGNVVGVDADIAKAIADGAGRRARGKRIWNLIPCRLRSRAARSTSSVRAIPKTMSVCRRWISPISISPPSRSWL